LAASNISEKEINQIKPASKGKSAVDFLNLLQLGKKNQNGKDEKDLEGEEILGVGFQMPNFALNKDQKIEKAGKMDLGNRIESGVSSAGTGITKNFLVGVPLGKDNLTEKKVVEEGNEKSVLLNNLKKTASKGKEDSNILIDKKFDSPDKKVDAKKQIKELYKVKEEKAVDEGLKVKKLSNKNEIVVAKGSGPQTKGRVFVRNEEKFLEKTPKTEVDGKIVSDSELRKVNTELKMVGEVSYGLKKFKKSFKEEDGKELLNAHNQGNNIEKFDVKLNKVENQSTARTDFAKIVEQVENGIKMHFNSQLKEMKIKLQPEELGEIDVKLKIENNMMKAEFVVENHTVKEALESKFQLLKENLEAKGINANEINVYVSTGDRQEKQDRKNFEFAQKNNFRRIKESKNLSKGIEAIDNQSLRNSRRTNNNRSSSSLDIFV
jgi:flagellar hook-length control protein FliK